MEKPMEKIPQQMNTNLTLEDIYEIKEIEKTTNHDVKAIEYFICNGCK